ncbi:hypothetical protein ACHAO7_012375, partial [Fusarium culmorum]
LLVRARHLQMSTLKRFWLLQPVTKTIAPSLVMVRTTRESYSTLASRATRFFPVNSRHNFLGLRLAKSMVRSLPLVCPGTVTSTPTLASWQRTAHPSSSPPAISSLLPTITWSSLFTCPPTST